MLNKADINEELSDYIRLLRLKYRKSQEDMGNLLSVSRNTYSKWEKNPIYLSLETLLKIGDVLEENILIFFQDYVAKSNKYNGV
jgi:transcriptional regulator with XRE-family HTH domain